MLTVDRFPAFNGNPPGVAVRFTYIEPTHEVVEALTRAGIDATSAFRSVSSKREITTYNDVPEDRLDGLMDYAEAWLLAELGGSIRDEQNEKLTPTEVTA